MALFVDLYARVCAELCAVFLPTGGLFLAGGIAAKNPGQFLRQGRFMARFERNYRTHLDLLLRATPVFLVHDYDLSLYGAAQAPASTAPLA
jgi:glucokinase